MGKVRAGHTAMAPVVSPDGRQILVTHADTLSAIDLSEPEPGVSVIRLSPEAPAREGEAWFNDATWCFQGWQSCASCHSSDGRVDGLNWDLLNDGVGNPKNSKSLLWTLRTPPAMSQGVRSKPEDAVRAG